MRLITIDPGTRHCGVAIWDDGRLTRAYLAQSPEDAPWLAFLSQLPDVTDEGVIEVPQIYPGKRYRAEDIIQLAASAGAVAGHVKGTWRQVRPAIWTLKTCQDKEIRLVRAWAYLGTREQKACEMPTTKLRRADVLDAIALGLHVLGRWQKYYVSDA